MAGGRCYGDLCKHKETQDLEELFNLRYMWIKRNCWSIQMRCWEQNKAVSVSADRGALENL